MTALKDMASVNILRKTWIPEEVEHEMHIWTPKSDLGQMIKKCLPFLPSEYAMDLFQNIIRSVVIESQLEVRVFRQRASRFFAGDDVEEYGVVSRKVITNAGIDFIVDAFQNSVELEILRFHGLGTGSTGEASTQTALVTELTTQYTGDARNQGTLAEVATTPTAFRTIGTNTLDSGTPILREHGIFSQAATGGGTMLDRSLFDAITLDGVAGDGFQSTYTLTLNSGG